MIKVIVSIVSFLIGIVCTILLLDDDIYSNNKIWNKILYIIIRFDIIFGWLMLIAINIIMWRN